MSGWEPAEVTRYEYEDPSAFVSKARWRWLRAVLEWAWALAHPPRIVTSITARESEWCRADVEALIAFIEMGRVGPHGQPMSEATSPLANPSNRDRQWEYKVEAWADFAAKAESEFKRDYKKRYGDDALDGIKFIVKKVPV